jgi:diguanylate cyclase (GGDEF)-like protein
MIYAYVALIRLTQLHRSSSADPTTRAQRLTAARSAVRALRRAATRSGPAAGPLARTLLHGYLVVARASLAQLSGRHEQALTGLARDELTLIHLDAPVVMYEAARVRARALTGLGEQQLATQHAHIAHTLALRHGWARRARWIRLEFGATATAPHGSIPRLTGQDQRAAADPYRRRLQALQQVSSAAAKVLDPRKLARVALDETLRILGAERAMLFLIDEHDGSLVPSFGRDAHRTDLTALCDYSSSLVARVAADRQALVVAGSQEGAVLGSQSAVVYGLRSIMIAPLELDQRLIGVVYLDSRVASGVFTEADIDLITAVTSHIAVSLETARAAQLELAVQVAREQRDTAELLRSAMYELTSATDPGQVLKQLLTVMIRTLPADRGCLLYQDGADRTSLGWGTVRPQAADLTTLTAYPTPAHGDSAHTPAPVAAVLGDAGSWLAVPLATHRHGNGALIAGSSASGRFTQAHEDLVAALASQGAAAYDRARLFARVHELATIDALTGVPNRRHFTELATEQMEAARRHRRRLVAMMIDIDHFKQVNDTYGHATGDDVIRTVALTLRNHVRHPDLIGRYGGEEFAVLQTWTGGDPVLAGERLRAATAAQAVPTAAGPIQVTVSIGTAVLTSDDDLETLLDRADSALYAAKQAGRNQVRAITTGRGPDQRTTTTTKDPSSPKEP